MFWGRSEGQDPRALRRPNKKVSLGGEARGENEDAESVRRPVREYDLADKNATITAEKARSAAGSSPADRSKVKISRGDRSGDAARIHNGLIGGVRVALRSGLYKSLRGRKKSLPPSDLTIVSLADGMGSSEGKAATPEQVDMPGVCGKQRFSLRAIRQAKENREKVVID